MSSRFVSVNFHLLVAVYYQFLFEGRNRLLFCSSLRVQNGRGRCFKINLCLSIYNYSLPKIWWKRCPPQLLLKKKNYIIDKFSVSSSSTKGSTVYSWHHKRKILFSKILFQSRNYLASLIVVEERETKIHGFRVAKVQVKKTCEIKWINFMTKIFWPNSIFAISKMAKNLFLNWEKV